MSRFGSRVRVGARGADEENVRPRVVQLLVERVDARVVRRDRVERVERQVVFDGKLIVEERLFS